MEIARNFFKSNIFASISVVMVLVLFTGCSRDNNSIKGDQKVTDEMIMQTMAEIIHVNTPVINFETILYDVLKNTHTVCGAPVLQRWQLNNKAVIAIPEGKVDEAPWDSEYLAVYGIPSGFYRDDSYAGIPKEVINIIDYNATASMEFYEVNVAQVTLRGVVRPIREIIRDNCFGSGYGLYRMSGYSERFGYLIVPLT